MLWSFGKYCELNVSDFPFAPTYSRRISLAARQHESLPSAILGSVTLLAPSASLSKADRLPCQNWSGSLVVIIYIRENDSKPYQSYQSYHGFPWISISIWKQGIQSTKFHDRLRVMDLTPPISVGSMLDDKFSELLGLGSVRPVFLNCTTQMAPRSFDFLICSKMYSMYSWRMNIHGYKVCIGMWD